MKIDIFSRWLGYLCPGYSRFRLWWIPIVVDSHKIEAINERQFSPKLSINNYDFVALHSMWGIFFSRVNVS